MNKIKLWFVRRWLHLLPYPELKEYSETQGLKLALDNFYGDMVKSMIKLYEDYEVDAAFIDLELKDLDTNFSLANPPTPESTVKR